MGTNKKRGISLIVLVITIIVMIILATAIILSLSNSSIISKANKAKTDSDTANLKEYVNTLRAEWELMTQDERAAEGSSTFEAYANKKLETKGYKIESRGINSKRIKSVTYMQNNVSLSEINLKKGNSTELDINLEEENENYTEYYIEINKKYYLINFNEIYIGKDEVDLVNIESKNEQIEKIIYSNDSVVFAELSGTKLSIIAKNPGETSVTLQTNLGQTFNISIKVANAPNNPITFYLLEENEYVAEEGMTWKEWFASEWNTLFQEGRTAWKIENGIFVGPQGWPVGSVPYDGVNKIDASKKQKENDKIQDGVIYYNNPGIAYK